MTGRDKRDAAASGADWSVPQLPRDRVVYGNLRTSFVRFDQLLLDLEDRRFDGYVELSGVDYEGHLYLLDGVVAGGTEQSIQGLVRGEPAVAAIKKRAGERDGTINVLAAPAGLITLATSDTGRVTMHEGLSTDFVDVDRLMVLLERDGFTGYVQFTLSKGHSTGYLFLAGGEVTDAVIADDGHTGSGLSLVPTLLQVIATAGARIDVYHIDTQPLDQGSHGAATAPHQANAAELATAWSAVLSTVETVVDEASEKGRFAAALYDVLQERSRDVPYFDPARAQCTFSGGLLHLNARPPEAFSTEMGDCLGDAVSRISFSLRKVDLESCIQARLEPVMEVHREAIERYGLPRTASAFLAA